MARKSVAEKHDEQEKRISQAHSKTVVAAREADGKLIKSAGERSVEGVIKANADLKFKVSQVLDDASNAVGASLQELRETQEAVKAAKAELETLHSIKVKADSLEALEAAHNEAVAEDARFKAEREQQRRRDDEQYKYDLAKDRKAERDAYAESFADEKVKFWAVLKEAEAAFDDRVAALEVREATAETLSAKVVELEGKLKSDIAAASAMAAREVTTRLGHEHAMALGKEVNLRNLVEANLKASEAKNVDLSARLTQREVQYVDAVNKVEAIAQRAIEGASREKVVVNASQSEQQPNRSGRS